MLARIDRASIVPTISLWLDSLILVGSGQGEIRMYDIVLNPILFFNKEENECSPLQVSLGDFAKNILRFLLKASTYLNK